MPAETTTPAPGIRPALPADARDVQRLLIAAFADEPEVAGLETALAAREDSRSFVAEIDGGIVGHVRLTRGWVDAPERLVTVQVLSPLSVEPARQRQGIGRMLVAHALGEAERMGAPAVFLEGDPGYYSRLGWRPAAELGVSAPSERIPAPACQAVALSAYEPWMSGRLVYADTFWALDCVGLRGQMLAEARAALGAE
jgi:putative acetyltransferase